MRNVLVRERERERGGGEEEEFFDKTMLLTPASGSTNPEKGF